MVYVYYENSLYHFIMQINMSPVNWGYKNTSSASLQRSKTYSNECPRYDTKQSDVETPVMLEIWGMQCPPSLWSLPGPLGHGVITNDRILFISKIEQFAI